MTTCSTCTLLLYDAGLNRFLSPNASGPRLIFRVRMIVGRGWDRGTRVDMAGYLLGAGEVARSVRRGSRGNWPMGRRCRVTFMPLIAAITRGAATRSISGRERGSIICARLRSAAGCTARRRRTARRAMNLRRRISIRRKGPASASAGSANGCPPMQHAKNGGRNYGRLACPLVGSHYPKNDLTPRLVGILMISGGRGRPR